MSGMEQPVGPEVDVAPARRPFPAILAGRLGRVEKLDAARATAPRCGRRSAGIRGCGPTCSTGRSPIATASCAGSPSGPNLRTRTGSSSSTRDGEALGTASLMSIRPEMRVVEIGNITLGPALQRSALATEAYYLFARHVFEELGYRRYEWKCDALNAPSRAAAARLGFSFEGVFRSH